MSIDAIAALREATGHDLPGLTTDPLAIAPFALNTRLRVAELIAKRGLDAEAEAAARKTAQRAIAYLVRAPAYLSALAADAAVRVDIVTGELDGLVTEGERAAATGAVSDDLLRRLLKAVRPPPPPPAVKPVPAPAPADPLALSPEQARRRQALVAAREARR